MVKKLLGYYIVKESELEELAKKYARQQCTEQRYHEAVGWVALRIVKEITKRL